MRYALYILECRDRTLYTGVARDPERRLREHNESPRGAKYTRARRPVRLRYQEWHASRSAAQKREAAVKRLSRARKLALIRSAKL